MIETGDHLRTLPLAGAAGDRHITYFADRPIDANHPGTTRAVLVVHGTDRDGWRYWRASKRAARRAGPEIRARTYLAAPQFFALREVRRRGLAASVPAWRQRAWKQGDPSRTGAGVSSFEVLDALLAQLADGARFPDLAAVVLVGHSAGAQLVQRHAAASAAADELERRGVRTRYVVINPSSYLYLDGSRPDLGHRAGLTLSRSALLAACPGYNRYKYGLERPNPYLARFAPAEVRARYGRREVVYLLGEQDDLPGDENLDLTCAALLQGRTRLERGRMFLSHLVRVYGESVRERHQIEIAPGLGHHGARILRSPAGLSRVFDLPPAAAAHR